MTGFEVVTFNVFHGSDDNTDEIRTDNIRPLFKRVMDDKPVDIWGLQEVKLRSGIVEMLEEFGYKTRYNDPEFCFAVSSRFTILRDEELVMSEHDYWLDQNEGFCAVVRDEKTGRRLKLLNGHPPAHIADKDHPSWPNVYEVHKDYKARMNSIGRNSKMECITFEDANIDFVQDRPVVGDDWGWWFDGPFKPNRAPEGTHGGPGSRRIDYVRTTDGLESGGAKVYQNDISDHNPYRRRVWFATV